MLNVLNLKKGQKIFVVTWGLKEVSFDYKVNEREVVDVTDMGEGYTYIKFTDSDEHLCVTKHEPDSLFNTEKEANEFIKKRREKDRKNV